MYSKTLVILTIIAAATLVVAFAGCMDTEGYTATCVQEFGSISSASGWIERFI
jgi:hypothetical protein